MTAVAPTGCPGFREGEEAVLNPTEKWFRICLDRDENWDDEANLPSDKMFQWTTTGARPGELSGSRSAKSTAAEALEHQNRAEGKGVRGVWSVTVAQLNSAQLHLHDDSALLPPPPQSPPGHTFLDLRHVQSGKGNPAKRARQDIRMTLLDLARQELQPKRGPSTEDAGAARV